MTHSRVRRKGLDKDGPGAVVVVSHELIRLKRIICLNLHAHVAHNPSYGAFHRTAQSPAALNTVGLDEPAVALGQHRVAPLAVTTRLRRNTNCEAATSKLKTCVMVVLVARHRCARE